MCNTEWSSEYLLCSKQTSLTFCATAAKYPSSQSDFLVVTPSPTSSGMRYDRTTSTTAPVRKWRRRLCTEPAGAWWHQRHTDGLPDFNPTTRGLLLVARICTAP